MGLRIFVGKELGYGDLYDSAILFDSVSEIAFGRIFHGESATRASEIAQAFLDWCEKEQNIPRGDVRALPVGETIALQDEFLSLRQQALSKG